jgi:hypothetical protein
VTAGKSRRRHLIIPSSSAAILLDVEGQEEWEFSVADRVHLHRLVDIYCGPNCENVCHVERKCPQCGSLDVIPVTTRRGKAVGVTEMQRCGRCGFELFLLGAVDGRISVIDRGTDAQIMFYADDAVRTWETHQMLSVARDQRTSRPGGTLNLLKLGTTA